MFGQGMGEIMDTSKEYIEMCEKATEIQEGWKPNEGDFSRDGSGGIFIIDGWSIGGFRKFRKDNSDQHAWLPRQDQLQEMIMETGHISNYFTLMRMFTNITCGSKMHFYHTLKTLEQLWLAFVMKELYQKIWKDHEWISE